MNYEQFLGPMFFEPYASDISSLINAAAITSALEVGCGTGRVTKHLREALPPNVKLVASDISPEMLAVAREKLKDLDVQWKVIDAQELPFENNSIDLVVCYFGYMFVPDRPKAFREAFRVLRKGGMLLMATWEQLENNEASNVFRRTVKKYFGDTLPASYRLPFSMCDEGEVRNLLEGAGFAGIRSEVVTKNSICASAAIAAEGLAKGGALYHEIMKRDPEWLGEIISEVAKELGEKYGTAPMIAPMSAMITRAVRL